MEDTIGKQMDELRIKEDQQKSTNQPTTFKTLTPETYTISLGSYCEWNRNVDLGPPSHVDNVPEQDVHIYNYYDALQYSLYETNHPETEDRTRVPRTRLPETGTTIAVLSSPIECMAILLEGGRYCPGDMLLVMSSTWLTVEQSDRDSSLKTLYVHKAITFDRGGQSFIDVFKPPRRVTYLLNFFTRACTEGQRDDGERLEKNLDCPMSSSISLVKKTDDKLWTRILMAEAGVHYPETLAFCYKIPYRYKVPQDAQITILKLDTREGVKNLVQDEVLAFLQKLETDSSQIVVKPSGVMWHGSQGVTFHNIKDTESICQAVVTLLGQLEPEDSAIIEVFYSPKPCVSGIDDLSFRLRATVCRGRNDCPITTTLICGVGKKDKPISGDNTKPQSLETTLLQWGFGNDIDRMKKELSDGSAKLLERIIDHENKMSVKEKGGIGAQTDVIGIDYIVGKKNGINVPIGIEVNSHDCTINCQLYEFMNPDLAGQSVSPLIETMCERSQRYLMWGKLVVVIGMGGTSKRFIWSAARKDNIKVILIDNIPEQSVPDVAFYIQYDFTDHTKDETHTENICRLLLESRIPVDGCCTFWEDCVPLTALVCQALSLHGSGVNGSKIAKKKSWTHEVLSLRTDDIPHFPRTYLYSERCIHIEFDSDIDAAVKKIGLPCMLKLEYGSSAVGVKLVHTIDECREHYYSLKNKLTCEADHPGIGLGHGNSMLLMKYIVGTEHDIDVVIYKRKLIAAYVSDNGPTRNGYFTETGACMPSCLRWDKLGQIVTAAYQCCTEIGLINGVFNVEMKMTPTGPKLLEINARMGGFYLRDWIRKCYGADILSCAFMIACGFKPILPKQIPKCQIMGIMCVPSAHELIFRNPDTLEILSVLQNQGLIRYNAIEEDFVESQIDEDTEEPICNIAVVADDVVQAKEKLLDVCEMFHLSNGTYNVSTFLEDFK